jgi:hypothetical protein
MAMTIQTITLVLGYDHYHREQCSYLSIKNDDYSDYYFKSVLYPLCSCHRHIRRQSEHEQASS